MSAHTMKALTIDGKSAASVKTIDTPKPGPGQILVKVAANALNPTDWKHLDYFGIKDAIVGSDFIGTVVDKDANAGNTVEIGERVAGCVRGGHTPGMGAFAEYLVTYPSAVTTVPDSISDVDGAGLGVGGFTALFGLFQPKHLGLPVPPRGPLPDVDPKLKVLVWSGASSTGQFAIQAARATGAYVIVTASSKNHEWLKSLGAAEAFDYSDPETPAKIAAAHPDLAYAFDSRSEQGSQEACARALSKEGGKVVCLLPFNPKTVAEANPKVKTTFLLLYTTSGERTEMFSIVFDEAYCQEDMRYMQEMASGKNGLMFQLLSSGALRPNRSTLQTGGFDAVLAGLDRMRNGQVSGEKLIYKQ
ncbi:unnamed protein product [Malassezia sympodialis ATCC 42132]|uniref:uncharacterized protein n=1 Tax=Malassezia sympodialis (strain ATCC 42132) TaxID=1230383 RepID=UPI0002C26792|nr:uncharacterized protein MSY001_1541 [Malassezia sympodialis ATCC 42132]CCU98835.1 unnamed protein product [Malassezia sympodialis ATCC 42132]|eukprot:XP_018740116.1 uncharacterized protein MSY001_1541 [Malassezia sympodialis ATCC 42132]